MHSREEEEQRADASIALSLAVPLPPLFLTPATHLSQRLRIPFHLCWRLRRRIRRMRLQVLLEVSIGHGAEGGRPSSNASSAVESRVRVELARVRRQMQQWQSELQECSSSRLACELWLSERGGEERRPKLFFVH